MMSVRATVGNSGTMMLEHGRRGAIFISFLWLTRKLADIAANECLLQIEVPILGAVYTYASTPVLWGICY